MKIKKGNVKEGGKMPSLRPKSNLSVMILAFIIIIVLTIVIFFGLRNLLKTESYWVLNTNVPGKVQVTPDMMEEVTVSLGGSPKTAINMSQIETGSIFTRYPASKGDILTESNTGVSLDTTTGIPDSWVVTAININSNDAAGGNVGRGNYFDIIGVDGEGGAKYIAINVLALDVKSELSTGYIEEELIDGPKTEQITMDTTLQYIFGMPAEAAARMHHAIAQFESIKVVKSPTTVNYGERNTENLDILYKFSNDDKVIDLYNGTDNEFTPILRDNNGRPVTKSACDAGIISPMELCKNAVDDTSEDAETTEKETPENNNTEVSPEKPADTEEKPTDTPAETPEEKPVQPEDNKPNENQTSEYNDNVINLTNVKFDEISKTEKDNQLIVNLTKNDELTKLKKEQIVVLKGSDNIDIVIKVQSLKNHPDNDELYQLTGIKPTEDEFLIKPEN